MTNALIPPIGFLFGADPELFVLDGEGRHVSAAGLIPGTKEEPFKVKGGAVQVDGMAAEFNIDPATTFAEFNTNINMVMSQLRKMLPKGYSLDCVPSVAFSKDVFDAAPEDAKILGCTPDYNAWTGGMNDVPDTSATPTLRCAGGHLHVGWGEGLSELDEDHVNNCFDLVKQLDWFLGAWSISVDSCPIRRSLYGKAGACRIKPYGVEYRVLSNFWLTSTERRVATWNRMVQAIIDMPKLYMPTKASTKQGYTNEALVTGINNSHIGRDLLAAYNYPIKTVARRGF